MDTSITNAFIPEGESARRWHFHRVLLALFQPRQTFQQLAALDRSLVSTPLFLLGLAAVASALIAGSIKEAAAASGQIELPPGFEYYTPEMQAQFQQAVSATSGPLFTYVMPTILGALGVVIAWVVAAGLLHLLLTLMGGRRSSQQTLNVVAWASLPFLLRHVVRMGAMLSTDQVIAYPGLSGFVPAETGTAAVYAGSLLALIDLYLVWHVALLVIGVRSGDNLSPAKAWTAVLFTVVLILLARALPAVIAAQFSDLTVVRPFLF